MKSIKPASILLILVISLLCSAVSAQNQTKLKEYFDDGEFFYWSEDYQEAVYYYLQMLKTNPDNANINFKAGYCYLNTAGEETKAIPYLEKASQNITPKYKARSFEETRAPLHVLFYLGNAYRINNEPEKALEVYQQFTSSPYYQNKYNISVVETEILACEKAELIKKKPINVEFINLGPVINTQNTENRPTVSGDGRTLVYVTSLKFYDAVMFTTLDNSGNWQEPVNISPEILSDGDLYPCGLSYDGQKLLLIKKVKTNDDIYISYLKDGRWTPAVSLGEPVNSAKDESHACFTKEGDGIYMSSNRSGGIGGYDIYYTQLDKSGIWSKPKNLGDGINSPLNDMTPFITNNDQTLFYSSQGFYNMGGFDIFSAVKDNNGTWSVPLNVGYPVNTTGDDVFFQPQLAGKIGYLARFRAEGYGKEDLYRIVFKQENLNIIK